MRHQGLAPDPTNKIVVVDERNRAVRKADHNLSAIAGDDADAVVLIARTVLEVTVRLASFQSSQQEQNRQQRSQVALCLFSRQIQPSFQPRYAIRTFDQDQKGNLCQPIAASRRPGRADLI
jgi:Rad3-related DNA helicase